MATDVVEPFVIQEWAGMLLVAVSKLWLGAMEEVARTVPEMTASSSKALLLRVLCGLLCVTTVFCMCGGSGVRHIEFCGVGCSVEKKPPMPCRDVAVVETTVKGVGIRVWSGASVV